MAINYYFNENKLFLQTHSKDRVIVFDVVDKDTLEFNLEASFGITANDLPDGAKFSRADITPVQSVTDKSQI